MHEILYLSSADIARLDIGVADIHQAVEAMFIAKSTGKTLMKPKLSVSPTPGDVAEALVGASLVHGVAGCKWLGVSQGNAARGLPSINANISLSGLDDGRIRTIMNGTWITGVRTAACTAVAARYLANPESRTIGFIGAGLQGRTHLDALLHAFPNLKQVLVFSRTSRSAEEFADHARALGLDARAEPEPECVVSDSDMVISTVPPSSSLQPFLRADWLKAGAFAGAVDLGRSWYPQDWGSFFDVIATDDREQSESRGRTGKMLVPGRFDVEIGELASDPLARSYSPAQRTALLFSGIALADIAVATLVEEMARSAGIGTKLEA